MKMVSISTIQALRSMMAIFAVGLVKAVSGNDGNDSYGGTYMRAYIHTYTHTHIHTYVHTRQWGGDNKKENVVMGEVGRKCGIGANGGKGSAVALVGLVTLESVHTYNQISDIHAYIITYIYAYIHMTMVAMATIKGNDAKGGDISSGTGNGDKWQ